MAAIKKKEMQFSLLNELPVDLHEHFLRVRVWKVNKRRRLVDAHHGSVDWYGDT